MTLETNGSCDQTRGPDLRFVMTNDNERLRRRSGEYRRHGWNLAAAGMMAKARQLPSTAFGSSDHQAGDLATDTAWQPGADQPEDSQQFSFRCRTPLSERRHPLQPVGDVQIRQSRHRHRHSVDDSPVRSVVESWTNSPSTGPAARSVETIPVAPLSICPRQKRFWRLASRQCLKRIAPTPNSRRRSARPS